MVIHIDTDRLDEYSLSLGDVLIAIAETYGVNLEESVKLLLQTKEAKEDPDGINFGIKLDSTVHARVTGLIASSTPTESTKDELLECAKRLKALYPRGKKPGTNSYWADSPALIVERLKLFFRKYGEYPLNEIVKATSKYVEDNIGNPYMRTLTYFIMKNDTRAGEVEKKSDLLNYLELQGEKSEDNEEAFVTLF